MSHVVADIAHDELPADARVERLEVEEGLSVLFTVRVEFVTAAPDIDLEALLWTSGSVSVQRDDGADRRDFHGVIESAEYLGYGVSPADGEIHSYRCILRPTIHGLAYRHRTRLFQELSTDAIIRQVLEEAGVAADSVDWSAIDEYPVRELVTQWKESELDFVLRLLEHEGIHFRFEHTASSHVLHLVDYPYVHPPIEGLSVLPFRVWSGVHESSDLDAVFEARLVASNTHDGHTSRDWNWEQPAQVMVAASAEPDSIYPRHEWHGGFITSGEGTQYATVRKEQSIGERYVVSGATHCLRFEPGKSFSLYDVFPDALAGDFLLRRVELTWNAEGLATHPGARHEVRFEAMPAHMAFRPPRDTPVPQVHGVERAVVTGPAGEEIHVNDYGQIKVHFEWDRENPVDDTASCWLRVMQMNTSGSMILPRLGWEMHVAFMDGDPSRPFALYKAYNDESMPSYGLPANKTQSSLQTATSPGGESVNELRLQDGSGGMELALSSSKDLKVTAGNNLSETIGANSEEKVAGDASFGVGVDESVSIGGNQSLSVTAALNANTVGDQTVTIGANDSWGITGGFTLGTAAGRSDAIGGLMNVLANKIGDTIKGSMTRSVGALQAIVSATAITETVGGSKTETVGAAKLELISKDKAENMSGSKMLTCGAITMTAGADMGVAAKGAILVNSAGGITSKCGSTFAVTGRNVMVTAPGGLTLKGGGGTFKLSGSTITVDASKFGGSSGPLLEVKGPINYKP